MFHNLQDFCTLQFFDRCSNDSCLWINFTKKFHCGLSFCLIHNICTAHDDRTGIFYLIIEELTKVSHIHFAFLCINNRCIAVKYQTCFFFNTLNCFDNI